MTELTERARAFRSAIAGFIEARCEAKLKGKEDDAATASKYEYGAWLADAASRAHNLCVVTHPIKLCHSAIKGATSVHYGPTDWVSHCEIGTHSLAHAFDEDLAISDAKHLDVHSFLKEIVDGRSILSWILANDPDLICALNAEPSLAQSMMASFRGVAQTDGKKVTSSALAKQVYWLLDDDPADNSHYHLLQLMFSSSLEHAIHRDIREAINATFEARGTKKKKPTYAHHYTYPSLVARLIGGSNPQNVSPLNKARGGVNYLLPSLPPPAWNTRRDANILKRTTVFEVFLWFDDVHIKVKALGEFLLGVKDKDSNKDIKNVRDTLSEHIAEQLALFGTTLRARYAAGWTRDDDCRLPRCEQLWLDPDRTELPPRDDPDHPEWLADDQAFNAEYDHGDWPDEVAGRFGNWLNSELRKAGLVLMAEPERNHWARQAILAVAWPIPRQRRAREETA